MMNWRRFLDHLPCSRKVRVGRIVVTFVNWTLIGDRVWIMVEPIDGGIRVGCPLGAVVVRVID